MRNPLLTSVRIAFALVLAAAASPPRAWCAWPHNFYTNLQIAPVSAVQGKPVAAPDGAGGVIIAWSDQRNGAGNADIFAQHITAAGTVAGGWPASGLAICAASGSQGLPAIASDGKGGAIIAWPDPRGSTADIYGMRVTGIGTFPAGWTANGVLISSVAFDEQTVVIATDGAAGAFIAWELVYAPGTDLDIYGAHVDSSGALIFSGPVSAPSAIQDAPSIAADGAGGAILSWEDNLTGNYEIKAIRQNAVGAVVWGINTIATNPASQNDPAVISDGAGGGFFAWADNRSGLLDIYAERLTATGAVAIGWSSTGTAVCVQAGPQAAPALISDGANGAIIAWHDARTGADYDIYAQRMAASGTPQYGWPTDGVAICTVSGHQINPTIVPDGSGGAIVAWEDIRSGFGSSHIFAGRVTSGGVFAPLWTYNGTPICLATGSQVGPVALVPDASGGAIMAWADYRLVSQPNVFAQNVDHFGQLGDARPAIVNVRDVAADQGGHVRLVWNSNYLDADPGFAIGSYWIWRQAPATVAQEAVRQGGAWIGELGDRKPDDLAVRGGRVFRSAATEAASYAWEFLASQPANGFAQYSYVAPTTSDSVAGHNPYTVFMVEARYAAGGAFWDSAPDSGYSVDNLPPAAPAPFTGNFFTGATHLHWGRNAEADFAVYRLHRGSSAGFVPGPGNLVVEQPDTGYVDVGSGADYYKLAAVDAHGNVSPYALLTPSGTTSVGPDLPTVIELAAPAPNPARGGATFEFGLPRDARVRIAIYDVGGRRVRELADVRFPAGRTPLRWDGLDQGGRKLAAGLYVLKLDAEGRSLTRRLAVVR